MKNSEKMLLKMAIMMAIVLVVMYVPKALKRKKTVTATAAPLLANKDNFTDRAKELLFGLYDEQVLISLTELKRDPFQPLSATVADPESEYVLDIELMGIFESRKGIFAVVNGRQVRQGDVFEGIKIEHIEKNGVYVKKWNKQYYVPLHAKTRLVVKKNKD